MMLCHDEEEEEHRRREKGYTKLKGQSEVRSAILKIHIKFIQNHQRFFFLRTRFSTTAKHNINQKTHHKSSNTS